MMCEVVVILGCSRAKDICPPIKKNQKASIPRTTHGLTIEANHNWPMWTYCMSSTSLLRFAWSWSCFSGCWWRMQAKKHSLPCCCHSWSKQKPYKNSSHPLKTSKSALAVSTTNSNHSSSSGRSTNPARSWSLSSARSNNRMSWTNSQTRSTNLKQPSSTWASRTRNYR